ncbi:peptidoglycan-binding domain-containing protein [Streptomyces iconiensis]|uniref:Peptidoglycan-binding protein n=1 Tax=Streptomyces iconiensis TaxID=1384038 RepID=A0ABT6ZPC5_9ACTN|nr:peptidoglycan-binding domain-containing protein [Streptomyces iconiensis]MDJ1130659.1 peptidoglycan-binding protein [Streptomyces iconiensis]
MTLLALPARLTMTDLDRVWSTTGQLLAIRARGREPDGTRRTAQGRGRMTAYERCPECGEDARACAHRAEDGREPVRESEDPLHIRPYVRLRESEAESGAGTGARTGAEAPDGADSGNGEGAARTTGAVGVPVPGPEAPMPDLSPFARHGMDETTELPTVSGGSRPKRAARKAAPEAASVHAEAEPSQAAPSHRRERRRPTTAVLAGVGVAAVLGAGLLTTQILTGGGEGQGSQNGEERAMRHAPTGAPTHALPSSSPPREKNGETEPASPSAVPSRTGPSGTPRADRDGEAHTERAAPSGKPSVPASRPGSSAGKRSPDADRKRPERPGRPSGATLRPGDSGAAVSELQRRLKQAGFLDDRAEEDGVYSSRVQEGVFRYQARYGLLHDDPPGEYGPATRRHLEARTSG